MACLASPLTSLVASQKQEAGREGGGEGEEDLPAKHWWLPQPGRPGEQQPAGFGGPSLVHHGDDGVAQVSTKLKLKETQ